MPDFAAMRIKVPDSLSIAMQGPQGPYSLSLSRYKSSEYEGWFDVTLDGKSMRWEVEEVTEENGVTYIEGLTGFETEEVWGDVYWYRLYPYEQPGRIQFWGDRVLCRTDYAAGI